MGELVGAAVGANMYIAKIRVTFPPLPKIRAAIRADRLGRLAHSRPGAALGTAN